MILKLVSPKGLLVEVLIEPEQLDPILAAGWKRPSEVQKPAPASKPASKATAKPAPKVAPKVASKPACK